MELVFSALPLVLLLPPTNGNVIFTSELQPWNAPWPMLVTLFGTTTSVILPKFRNAKLPILVSPSCKITFPSVSLLIRIRFPQLENALAPILVTLAGIFICVKLVAPLNAEPPISVNPVGSVTLPTDTHPANA